MGECVSVDELDKPIEDPNHATKNTEHDGTDDVALGALLLLSDAAGLTKHIDDCDNQTAE